MTQWFNLMIDVECMGMPPNGALMGIGACFFDHKTDTIGPTFKKNINLATAVRDGGVIDASTVLWWLRQSDEARKSSINDTYDIRQVLQEFREFINEHSREPDVVPWGNSASFDLGLISSAYDRIGQSAPWKWSAERCFRTMRNAFPSVEYNPDEKGDGAHDALKDAIFQARHLAKIANRNKPKA